MIARGLLPRRKQDFHKGDAGRVLVIAGSVGFSGAAALCAEGAIRAGAGLVTLAIPESLLAAMVVKLTEVMLFVSPQTRSGSLSKQASSKILAKAGVMNAVALGPGVSTNVSTISLVHKLVAGVATPLVIDADGLNALEGHTSLIKNRCAPTVLTPHVGEMSRLSARSKKWIESNRKKIVKSFAHAQDSVVVLKGHRTLVADPSGRTYVNRTGNPGMASGGMGDVLTGIIVALLGQGLDAFDASCLGVYLHGLAGDIAAEKIGSVGLIASDLLATIPLAIKRYQAKA